MDFVIYNEVDGSLSVLIPSGEISLEEVIQKDVPQGIPFQVVSSNSLPIYAAFRNSWYADFNDFQGVFVSLEKAKLHYKEVADRTASSLSLPFTQEYMRLMAIGGDTTAVQAQLKSINAAAEQTAYLDATSVPELVACWPPELGPNPFLPRTAE